MAYFKTIWENGKTPINATNLNIIENGITTNYTNITTLQQAIEELNKLKPVNLWTNPNTDVTVGTAGPITLSDSLANYEYIEIFYSRRPSSVSTTGGAGKTSVKIYNPNGRSYMLNMVLISNIVMQITGEILHGDGNTITIEAKQSMATLTLDTKLFYGGSIESDLYYIEKINGYKK